MKTVTLPARCNGKHRDTAAPFDIPENAQLFIAVATPENNEETDADFRADWYALSAMGLARAYGDDEPEYDETKLQEINPAYEPL